MRLLFLLLLAWLVPAIANAQRIATIVANQDYDEPGWTLSNPISDAHLLKEALESVGFEVELVPDADEKAMKSAFLRHASRLKAAGPSSVGFFLYTGHGVQSQGVNYLIPTDLHAHTEQDVWAGAPRLDLLMQALQDAGNDTNFIVLDACRNSPLPSESRGIAIGLAPSEKVRGTFIAYSTAPNASASDGAGEHSPYAEALAEYLKRPGLSAEAAFRYVASAVEAATAMRQQPWTESGLRGADFCFGGCEGSAPDVPLDEQIRRELAAVAAAPDAGTSPGSRGRIPVVVIDAGHGGKDTGAVAADGRKEKDINLTAALQLKDQLERSGGIRVVLTRSDDIFADQAARVGIAEQNNADLFITLHSDSAPNPDVTGFAIFTNSERGKARIMEAAEAVGRSAPELAALRRRIDATAERSDFFARLLRLQLDASGFPSLTRPIRQGGFLALNSDTIPSVMIEMGFISNPEDLYNLTNDQSRQVFIDALAQAIYGVFSGAAPPVPEEDLPAKTIERGKPALYDIATYGAPALTGETIDSRTVSAGHGSLPVPSMVRVSVPVSGKSIMVRVNDRVVRKDDAIITLSLEAARELGLSAQDLPEITVEYVGPAPAAPWSRAAD
ncbi:MAG TPA: N-acetylmuramoyl-L-alanine amidase [Hyphomonas sp.]|nr:N-acetylmuramoyl-L-alanine amidase [Hyphomonas sp.]HPE48965.1 N-acetylmuramoyl-L-alanine amidase [Hyphomonas sp.]